MFIAEMAPLELNPGQRSCHEQIGVAAVGEVDDAICIYKAAQPFPAKLSVRGFRRGNNANNSNLSPLTLNANNSPSNANSNIGFGIK